MEKYKELLYDWIFHFNPYKDAWAAIPRNLYTQYCNDHSIKGVIYSSKLETLMHILFQIKGNKNNLNQLK
jgi:hypothetical protein